MKKNVLISFVTEADTDLQAVFNLNKILFQLSDSDLVKFDVFDVVECGTDVRFAHRFHFNLPLLRSLRGFRILFCHRF